jgi:M6 family metalloprotease-like protein
MGEIHRLPDGTRLDFHPDGGWRLQMRRVADTRARLLSQGRFDLLNAALAAGGPSPSATAVTGVKQVPAVMFRFADAGSATAFDTTQYANLLFGATTPADRPYSMRTYYDEVSTGLVSIQGRVIGWLQLSGPEEQYTGPAGGCPLNPFGTNNCNGIFSTTAANGMRAGLAEALAGADAWGIDWGQFDNDGPDGQPNSGDDDGIVDMLIFVQSEGDGACLSASNNHIWSHKWVLASTFVTSTPSANGGYVGIRDYTIQSGLGGPTGCSASQIMAIGTATHETGHALGLPDLYDTSLLSEGIGNWGLMSSGNWATQPSPAAPEAWSRQQLGWVMVREITGAGPFALGPVAVGDTVFLVRPAVANTRGEYFLIESRRGIDTDSALIRVTCGRSGRSFPSSCNGGLLIWHVDSTKVAQTWATNSVNAGVPKGVSLIQADGLNHLEASSGGNRGDAGDPYPGVALNTALTDRSTPALLLHSDGRFAGVIVDSIALVGDTASFRIGFGLPLRVTASGPGAVGSTPPFSGDTLFSAGDTVTLTAVPNADALLEGWSGDTVSAKDTLRLTMTRPWTVAATFVPLLVASAPTPGTALMGSTYSASLSASGGTGSYTWTLLSGALPKGVTLRSSGLISGVVEETGSYAATAQVMSGTQTQAVPISISVTAPALTTSTVLGVLLGTGGTLTSDERRYLDLLGNRNGQFDVGDFLAFIDRTSGAVTAEMMAELLREVAR